jgi:dihydrofolate synthase/folylpolyglutamate synthase
VAEPGQHLALPPEAIVAASGGVARVGPTVRDALRALGPGPGRVLICGSLYLAGEVLRADIGRADIGRADIGRADGGEGR